MTIVHPCPKTHMTWTGCVAQGLTEHLPFQHGLGLGQLVLPSARPLGPWGFEVVYEPILENPFSNVSFPERTSDRPKSDHQTKLSKQPDISLATHLGD